MSYRGKTRNRIRPARNRSRRAPLPSLDGSPTRKMIIMDANRILVISTEKARGPDMMTPDGRPQKTNTQIVLRNLIYKRGRQWHGGDRMEKVDARYCVRNGINRLDGSRDPEPGFL